MSSIVQSLGDVVKSVFELFGSIVQTIFDIFRTAFEGRLQGHPGHLLRSLGAVPWRDPCGRWGGQVHRRSVQTLLFEDVCLANVAAGNFFVLAVIAVAFYGFLVYQRRQGQTVKVGNKKLN